MLEIHFVVLQQNNKNKYLILKMAFLILEIEFPKKKNIDAKSIKVLIL